MSTVPTSRSTSAKPGPTRLSSWKDIAAYLHRDPRTVQLWEKNEGLPVRRLGHKSRATVYAFTDELDAWMRERSLQESSALDSDELPAAEDEVGPDQEEHFLFQGRHRKVLIGVHAGLAVACLVFLGLWLRPHRAATQAASPKTLIVLPFEDQTALDEVLVEGFTKELITELERDSSLTVLPESEAARYKGRNVPLHQIAVQSNAALALRGTIARAGDKFDITVEFLDARHETHLWGATYTRSVSEMRTAKDTVASMIALAVTQTVSRDTARSSSAYLPVDPKVKQAYLEGKYYWNQRSLEGLQKAIESFQKAISLDSRYAPAYAGLAEVYDLMTDKGVMDNDEAFRRAKAAAQTALSIDPNSSDAYIALAMATYRQDWDFTAAERYFLKAIQLDPSCAVAHQWYGEFLGDIRRFDESIAELRKARELMPLSPMIGADLAEGYLHAGRPAEAEAELRRLIDLYPDFAPAHSYLTYVYLAMRNFSGARTEARIYSHRIGNASPYTWLDIQALAAEGRLTEARSRLRILLDPAAKEPVPPYFVAQLLFATGQDEGAYSALEKAFQQRSWWMVTMMVDSGFERVRTQPRFLDLARRVGLPNSALSVGQASTGL